MRRVSRVAERVRASWDVAWCLVDVGRAIAREKLPRGMRRPVGVAIASYEAYAIWTGRAPTITALCRRFPWLRWAVVAWLVWHLVFDEWDFTVPSRKGGS